MRHATWARLCPVLLAAVSLPAQAAVEASNCRTWYEQPASRWVEALPLGNGRLGAMVFGGVTRERLQLNEESLWAGEPVDPYPDGFSANLAALRELVLAGKIAAGSTVEVGVKDGNLWVGVVSRGAEEPSAV